MLIETLVVAFTEYFAIPDFGYNIIQVCIPKVRGFHTFYIKYEFKDDMSSLHAARSSLFSVLISRKQLLWQDNKLIFAKSPSVVIYVNYNNL